MTGGELIRRFAFDCLDKVRGGKLKLLKEKNKSCILQGVDESYPVERIEKLLDYACKHSDFYKPYQKETSLDKFPVMTKADYNAHREEILCGQYRNKKLYKLSTSGSTGTPFHLFCDSGKLSRIHMNFISVMELNGFRMGMKRGEFRVWIPGKNTISPWKSFKNNLIMMDISNMGEEALAKICACIKKKKIQVLVAYSGAITALVSYMQRHKIDPAKWKVEMIFTMGEALPQDTYERVKEVFGFEPVRSYGNNENGFVAVGLSGEKDYTIDLYNFHVEILKLDSDEPQEDGKLGRIVVTDYYNRAFPVIRYDTGDTGIRIRRKKEGKVTEKFTEIYGRRGSLLFNTKGEPLSIHVFMNVLINLEGIVHQAKCIQWGEKDYQLLVNADREKIKEKELVDSYRHYLGEDAQIKVDYVEEIPQQASGKTMVCENKWK